MVKADSIAVKFPSEGDPIQFAMIMANPPTAWLLLKSVIDLKPGDWVIQNAANSAVGQYVMQLAKIYGLKTVNVVRRDGLDDFIARAGGDVCAVDGPDLGERVKEATGGAEIKLAIDAVAGDATQHLADCLSDKGTIANYGLLSAEPCRLLPDDIIFREITLTGVWLTLWIRRDSSPKSAARFIASLPAISRTVACTRLWKPPTPVQDQGCGRPRHAGRTQREDRAAAQRRRMIPRRLFLASAILAFFALADTGIASDPPILATGTFRDGDPVHRGSGELRITDSSPPSGLRQLGMLDMKIVSGPNLRVYLVREPDPLFSEDVTAGFQDLGPL